LPLVEIILVILIVPTAKPLFSRVSILAVEVGVDDRAHKYRAEILRTKDTDDLIWTGYIRDFYMASQKIRFGMIHLKKGWIAKVDSAYDDQRIWRVLPGGEEMSGLEPYATHRL
jgi:hypothetical protein